MKIIISPAKSLDFQKELPTNEFSMPLFLDDSISINKTLKLKSTLQLKSLMSISDKLADLNGKGIMILKPRLMLKMLDLLFLLLMEMYTLV